MSRIGKKPVLLSDKVKLTMQGANVTAKGEKGTLSMDVHPAVTIKVEDGSAYVNILKDNKRSRVVQGMTRSLLFNMVTGVSQGMERNLEINGIGYRAEVQGKTIVFNLGYSHPINFELPDGVSAAVDRNFIKLTGIDKQLLGHTAASIRSLRPPEPYKGKGIKYVEEYIRRKAGKTGVK